MCLNCGYVYCVRRVGNNHKFVKSCGQCTKVFDDRFAQVLVTKIMSELEAGYG